MGSVWLKVGVAMPPKMKSSNKTTDVTDSSLDNASQTTFLPQCHAQQGLTENLFATAKIASLGIAGLKPEIASARFVLFHDLYSLFQLTFPGHW